MVERAQPLLNEAGQDELDLGVELTPVHADLVGAVQ